MLSREPRFKLGQTVKILLEDAPDFGIILQIEEDFNQFIYLIQGEFYTENELSEIDLFSPNFNAQKVFADIATDLQDSQNSPNRPRIPLFEDIFSLNPNLLSASSKEIEYRDSTPKPFEIQIPLWEYFERIKRHKADRWQRDLCDRLQEALHSRYLRRWWAVIHAEGQLGKTSIISQCFPAWILGHLPSFRYALAMYNITQSQKHSDVVINIMTSATHTDIFPNKDGWLFVDEKAAFGRKISKAGWMTNARREINDSQFSFNPVGLRSGLTGAGYDWLSIDDPYRDSKDAFSPIINEGLKNFYDFTVQTRTSLYSCISGMFHRYAPEDLGGYLLDTGDFEYLRYCSQYDGPYIHEKTGRRYDDPIERKKGEYISPNRRPPHYYDKPRKKPRVWLSMFQGRPSSEFGDFFNVGKISLITKQEAAEREKECLLITRSYDLASSVSDEAAFSVGVKMGIRSNGRITIFDMWRERVDTAKRSKKQKELAAQDGPTVTVVIPKDPGQAGETTVFYIRQLLKGYNVATRETSGSKEERAHDFSVAVNDDLVEMVEYTGENPQDQDFNWNLQLKTELRDFPLSPYKDITDACADGYNQLFETWTRGTVVKNYKWYRNFIKVSDFMKKFAISSPNADFDEEKLLPGLIEFSLPPKFAVYAAVKIDQDASKPTSAIIAARAPQFSQCPEDLFILDEYKRYNANLYELFDWLESRLKTWQTSAEPTIWLHPDSEQYFQTISSKLPYRVSQFHEDKLAGHNELNWYLMPHDSDHPFGATTEQAAHLYFVCHDDYYYGVELKNENEPQSFYHLRQEAHTWGFGSNGEPTEVGQVLDCLRIITHRFKTYAENYTLEEEREMVASKYLPAKVQQAYSEGNLTMPMQQRIDFANHLAKLDMQDKYGEDVFEDALDNDLWFLVDS